MSTLFQSSVYADAPTSETELRRSVLDRLRRGGWRVHMLPQQRGHRTRTATGWPDVVAVKAGRMLAIELKTEDGDPTDAQDEWLAALAEVPGIETAVLRPSGFVAWAGALDRGRVGAVDVRP